MRTRPLSDRAKGTIRNAQQRFSHRPFIEQVSILSAYSGVKLTEESLREIINEPLTVDETLQIIRETPN